jgi:hypothetical protein
MPGSSDQSSNQSLLLVVVGFLAVVVTKVVVADLAGCDLPRMAGAECGPDAAVLWRERWPRGMGLPDDDDEEDDAAAAAAAGRVGGEAPLP